MNDVLTTPQERGASAVEYGLLIAGVAAVIFVAIVAFGGLTKNLFADSCDKVSSKAASGVSCAR